MLLSFGDLYIGVDPESFHHIWRESDALTVHFGRLRLEWGCIPSKDHGPTSENTYKSRHGADASSHGLVSGTGP